jgi:hypothetical protein
MFIKQLPEGNPFFGDELCHKEANNMHELITDEDFKFAIESGKNVKFLSMDRIGSGQIKSFNDLFIVIGDESLVRLRFKFFIEIAIL